ncbi:hypothetical protein [Agromyces sp. ZXT2-6]|uniref:hypothetical protein n=1 Tax=Agromyces sp. ZXT2-6 TaxID=3461153 RepID=UPI0040551394
MRLAVLVGAIALAIGFGVGWLSGSMATAELIAEREGSAGDPADELALPLAAEPRVAARAER